MFGAISPRAIGPVSHVRAALKGRVLERENRISSVMNYRLSVVISHEVAKLRPVVLQVICMAQELNNRPRLKCSPGRQHDCCCFNYLVSRSDSARS